MNCVALGGHAFSNGGTLILLTLVPAPLYPWVETHGWGPATATRFCVNSMLTVGCVRAIALTSPTAGFRSPLTGLKSEVLAGRPRYLRRMGLAKGGTPSLPPADGYGFAKGRTPSLLSSDAFGGAAVVVDGDIL